MSVIFRLLGTSNPSTPFPTLERRSLAINTANRQLAVGDESGTIGQPLPLIAVRFFDVRAAYATGDIVVYLGAIYRALGTIAPGAFNGSQWELMSAGAGDSATVTYVNAQDALRVAKAGDTMTGDLTISKVAPQIILNKTSDTRGELIGKKNGLFRWALILPSGGVEPGANAGSDFNLQRYDDAGNLIGNVLQFYRSDGLGLVFGDPTVPLGIATKQYVDTKVATVDLSTKVSKAGDTMSGALIVTPKGSTFGGPSGTLPTGALVPADANIKMYDGGGGNWCGFGTDTNGIFWLRTGLSGTPAAAFYVDTSQFLILQKDPTAALGAATKQYTDTKLPLAGGTLTGPAGYNETALTYVAGGTTAWDLNVAPCATVAIGAGNTTIGGPSNIQAGRVYTIRFVQSSTPRAVAWASNFKWNGGAGNVPVISIGSGAVDCFTFIARAGALMEEIGRSQGIA